MSTLLIKIGLYIASLGGFTIPVVEVATTQCSIENSVVSNIKDTLIYKRARRLYLEYSFLTDTVNVIRKLDWKLKTEFDTSDIDLDELYDLLIKENKNYVWASSRTK